MDWETREQDLVTAQDVLGRHYEDPEENLVGIQEVVVMMEGRIQVERSDWVVELEETFETQYGESIGNDVTKKVITELLVSGQSVH